MVKYRVSFRVDTKKFEWTFILSTKFDTKNAEAYVFGEIKACLEENRMSLPTYAEDIVVWLEDTEKGIRECVWTQDKLDIVSVSID